MDKIDHIIKSLNQIIKESEDEEETIPSDSPAIDTLKQHVSDYESNVAKLLRKQRKFYISKVTEFVNKDESEDWISAFISYLTQDVFSTDEFTEEMEEETRNYLLLVIPKLSTEIMDVIDKDVRFNTLSKRTTDWIDSWAKDLAQLMNLSTHESIQKELNESLENGESIQKVTKRLKELPEFDRKRAKVTAQTEILTAYSRSTWESYQQSPAVIGQKWRHSGTKGITARKTHVKLDGTVIGLDEQFNVSGHKADYPRDTKLPASERVRCHCTTVPVTDPNILGLSAEEKEKIRQEALKKLNKK